jgi:hypothetical protein
MESMVSIIDLSHLIQLAIAPVFLLAGIAGFLNVMSGRLGRIVDRARVVERWTLTLKNAIHVERNHKELRSLHRRMTLINWSIGFCTISALLVCLLVVMMFAGSYWRVNVSISIAAFFVLAMFALIGALLLFIKETLLATRTLREGAEFIDDNEPQALANDE